MDSRLLRYLHFLLPLFAWAFSQTTHAESLTLTGAERWVVVAARQDQQEAISLARSYGLAINGVRVIRSSNGWYAVAIGPVPGTNIAEVRKRLEKLMYLPSDAYLSRGERYQETVFVAKPSPILAATSYDGKDGPASVTYGNILVMLGSTPKGDMFVPWVRFGGSAAELRAFNLYEDVPFVHSQARIVQLDPSSPEPQVLVTTFTGGAHCCEIAKVATRVDGTWRVVNVGMTDGGYRVVLDDNDAPLLTTRDGSFLYRYASYAGSVAPPVLFRLSGTKLVDVSADPQQRNYYATYLSELERTADNDSWHNNGFLAGWVAAKARVGAVDDAWVRMLSNFDRYSDWELTVCSITPAPAKCPQDRLRKASFPEALYAHLKEAGYPLPAIGGQSTARVAPSSPPPAAAPPAQKSSSSGSGFFVSREGHFLTNAHVVDGCSTIRVTKGDEGAKTVRLLARDQLNDLALLKTDFSVADAAPLRTGVRLGEGVAAFGFPLTGILASGGNFTLGNVTALAGLRDDSRELQMSAPVQPGNSGGPLLDETGAVVGVVVSKLNALKVAAATDDLAQNVNFAIKASVAQAFLETQGVKAMPPAQNAPALKPADLADRAKAISGFVQCLR